MSTNFDSIDVLKLIKEMANKWWIILISIAIFSLAAYFFTQSVISPVYRASSMIFIGKEAGDPSELSVADLTIGQRLTTDYRVLISSQRVLEEVREALPLEHRNFDLSRNLTVQIIDDSRFINISYEDTNPEKAMVVVNVISEVMALQAEEIVGVRNVQIVDHAQMPSAPIKPVLRSNVALGGLIGFFLAVFTIMLKVMLINKIRNQDDIETELSLPVLGVIPKIHGKADQEVAAQNTFFNKSKNSVMNWPLKMKSMSFKIISKIKGGK